MEHYLDCSELARGVSMPEVIRFYIIVQFYYREHPPTHFRAINGEDEALIEVEKGARRDFVFPTR